METGQLKDIRIAFIGTGNMAEAIINGLVESSIVEPPNIHAADIDSERLELMHNRYGISIHSQNSAAAKQSNICLMAVKPQVLPEVLADTIAGIAQETLVVSIAAGMTTARIESILPHDQRVVRVMPNTPALIGMGLSAICTGSKSTAADMDLAEVLMGTVGKTIRVDESDMDAVTALSGSGPAYQFYLLENMIAAGIELGLEPDTARKLACATAEGATRLMIESGMGADELRTRVTSKGGTTAAALAVLDEDGVDKSILKAIRAARDRSVELAGD